MKESREFGVSSLEQMLHFRSNQLFENFTSNSTIARNDLVAKFVVALAASEIAQSNSKLQCFQRRYPLRSTFSGSDEKWRLCFLATVQWRHHLEDTPSSISVRSVACLGTKIGVWISTIRVRTVQEPQSRQSLISLRICLWMLVSMSLDKLEERNNNVRGNRFHSFSKIRSVFFLNFFVYTWRTRGRLRHRRPIDPDVPAHVKKT